MQVIIVKAFSQEIQCAIYHVKRAILIINLQNALLVQQDFIKLSNYFFLIISFKIYLYLKLKNFLILVLHLHQNV